eukprot:2867059-Rhodomonas_salina.1
MVGKRMWLEAEEEEAGWKTVGLTATTLPSRSAQRLCTWRPSYAGWSWIPPPQSSRNLRGRIP